MCNCERKAHMVNDVVILTSKQFFPIIDHLDILINTRKRSVMEREYINIINITTSDQNKIDLCIRSF